MINGCYRFTCMFFHYLFKKMKIQSKVSLHVMGYAVLFSSYHYYCYPEMNLDMLGNVGMLEVSFMYCTGTLVGNADAGELLQFGETKLICEKGKLTTQC